jgi:ubiquinone/menaquinone biosynthesis C-methylase UbiE
VGRHASTADELVLDVGCGTGSITALLARRGHRVVGVDTDVEGLAAAACATEAAWFIRADGARLPFRRDTFDGATVMDVLEHVEDEAGFLAEGGRVVKSGGWVLVTVPAMPWLWSHADEVAGHLRRYTRRSLSDVVVASGLKLEAVSYYQALLFPLVAATRLLGRGAQGMREREQRPPRAANAVLSAITNFELALGERVPWRWGSSLVAVCRKP